MLLPGSQWANLEASLNVYARLHIQEGAGLTVYYSRGVAPDTLPDRWVEIRYAPFVPFDFVGRDGGSVAYANHGRIMINLNLYERLSTRQGRHSTQTLNSMADTVQGHYKNPQRIFVQDYATVGYPQVGSVVVEQCRPQALGTVAETQVEAINITVECSYLERYTLNP